ARRTGGDRNEPSPSRTETHQRSTHRRRSGTTTKDDDVIRRHTHRSAMAGCREVAKVLQAYLDGQTDDVTAQRVARHLEACRRCGLEARTYREIKAALARRVPLADELALERLRAFATSLADAPPTADQEHA